MFGQNVEQEHNDSMAIVMNYSAINSLQDMCHTAFV
jgi:hypothetical protein